MIATAIFAPYKLTTNMMRFQEESNSLELVGKDGSPRLIGPLYVSQQGLALLAPGKDVRSLKVKVTVEVL